MNGTFGKYFRAATPNSKVKTPVAVTQGLTWPIWSANCHKVSTNDASAGIGMPKKDLTCDVAISIAAPALKPMITVCEMKFTRAPKRAMPISNSNTPVSRVTVRTRRM